MYLLFYIFSISLHIHYSGILHTRVFVPQNVENEQNTKSHNPLKFVRTNLNILLFVIRYFIVCNKVYGFIPLIKTAQFFTCTEHGERFLNITFRTREPYKK